MASSIIVCLTLFQFPPLREGRLAMKLAYKQDIKISIPAPARGATCRLIVY